MHRCWGPGILKLSSEGVGLVRHLDGHAGSTTSVTAPSRLRCAAKCGSTRPAESPSSFLSSHFEIHPLIPAGQRISVWFLRLIHHHLNWARMISGPFFLAAFPTWRGLAALCAAGAGSSGRLESATLRARVVSGLGAACGYAQCLASRNKRLSRGGSSSTITTGSMTSLV